MPDNLWDQYATAWDWNPANQAHARMCFASLQARLPVRETGFYFERALDFGCGTGLLTEKLAPFCETLVALDSSRRMMATLKRKLRDLDLANIIPVLDAVDAASIQKHEALLEPFDLLTASSVCGFLPNYEEALQRLVSLLRPGAFFAQWDWSQPAGQEEQGSGLGLDRVAAAYASAGLKIHYLAHEFSMTSPSSGKERWVLMGLGQRILAS